MKKILIVLLALTLSLIIIGCSNGSNPTTTTIKANGSVNSTRALTINGTFASGELYVNGQDISSELKPTKPISTSTNNVEFEATVTVNTPKVTLVVNPAFGFVFDEWELDKAALRKSSLTKEEKAEVKHILNDVTEKAETLTVDAKYAVFFKATFDHGFYVDFNAQAGGNGTKESPFSSVAELKATIEKLDIEAREELTLKIAKNEAEIAFDFSALATIEGLEEVKIIGGFDASSNWSYNEGDRTLISNLNFSGDLEIEVEHLTVGDLTIDGKAELEFKDIVVKGTLTVPEGQTVGNIKLETGATIKGKNLTFVNSVVPYYASFTYYHSIIIEDGVIEIKGQNNIIIGGDENKEYNSNYYLKVGTKIEGFKVEVDPAIKAELKRAKALTEEFLENLKEDIKDFIEDLIEEDIFGFDREESEDGNTVYVSYGPVEL